MDVESVLENSCGNFQVKLYLAKKKPVWSSGEVIRIESRRV